jgi:O-antigen ligase
MTFSAATATPADTRMRGGKPLGLDDLRGRREAAMAEARQRSSFGHWAHVGAGMFYLATLGFSSHAAVWGFAVLAVVALARSPFTIRTYWYLLNDRVGWLIILWAAVSGLAILWSPDQMQGVVEWRPFRALFTAMMLWPVVDYAPQFIAGFLVGVLGQNGVQLAQGLGVVEIPLGDGPRLRGLTHPVNTATLCLIAMCWHLSAIMIGRGLWRRLSVLGFIAAGIGMVYTGSRGPWIAAALTLPACVVGIAWRFPAARRIAIVAAIGVVVLSAVSWPLVRGIVEYRLEMTQEDVAHIEQGTVEQELGLSYRLACWQAAWETFLEHPVGGVGAGGYHVAAKDSSQGEVLTQAHHAHSLYLHVLASTGLMGLLVLLAVMAGALHRAWRDKWDHPYAAGTFFAILGWLLAGLFDAVHLNGQMLGVFAAMVTITLPTRPAARIGRKKAQEEQNG